MGATVRCASCEAENPAAARFCMSCGGSLELPCPACGTELPPGARFCFNCGNELEAGATAEDDGRSAMDVTNEIADQLREITAGAGERRRVTMMFCDVKDSTATAELLDPEDWSTILREAMDCFVTSVERYGGTVARLLGDAILAYFGAPEAHEDDPQRAILAGLDILACTRELCQRVQERHGTDFDVRIGVNTGLVVVGDIGSQQLTEYAALGDAANVAARMEQTADPGTVRVAEDTHRLVAPLFEFVPVGRIEVKGRSEPLAAYTVARAIGMPGQVRGIEGLTSPMVGRDEELARLVRAAEDVVAGSGRIASVMGEAGLGKSRLAAELRAVLTERHEDVDWVTGQCHSYQDTTPYAPFAPLLRDCLEIDDTTSPEERTEHVIGRVTSLLGEDGREQALYLCHLLGLPLSGDDDHLLSFLDPGTLRGRVFDAVVALLEGLARRRSVVVELEDLHWADPTSIELTAQLLGLTERAPVFVLLVFRPRRDEPSWGIHEAAMRQHAHRHVTVALQPLDDGQSQALIANLLKVEGLSARVRSTILTKSEGNPFFVEEVIRSLLDEGIIVAEDDRYVATREISDVAVPDTLAAVLATRLDQLDAATRRIVQTAAVLGREFSLEMLEALADPEVDVAAVLRDLQRRELIVEQRQHPEVVLAFRHALTRDTAYETLLLSVRRDLHRLVGKLVEERHPERVFDLARHFAEADEPTRAVPYLVQAGEAAFGAFSRADAADYFRRALDLWGPEMGLEHPRRAYEGLGNALMYLGEMEAAEEAFREMLEFSREHGDPIGEVSALNKAGMVLLMTGRVEAAEASMLEAKQLAEAEGHQPGVAEFHVGYCVLNVSQGRLDDAEEHLGEAAEVCFTLDPHHRNFGLLHYSESIIYQLRFDEAREAIQRAREQAELDDDYAHLAGSWYAEALLEMYSGTPLRANELAQHSLELSSRVAAHIEVAGSSLVVGLTSLQMGDLDVAGEHLQQVVDIAAEGGPAFLAPVAHAGLAAVAQWVHGPGVEAAEHERRLAQAAADTPMGNTSATGAWAGTGLSHLLDGDVDAADAAIRRAQEVSSALTKLTAQEILICSGGIALARDDVARAGALFDEALELIESTGLGLYRSRALLGQALVAGALGDRRQGQQLLTAAEDDALGRHLRMDAILVLRAASDVYAELGMDHEADEARERLSEVVADVASRIEDHETRRSFLTSTARVG